MTTIRTITIEDNIKLMYMRISRDESNNLSLQAEYVPMGTDTLDEPVAIKPLKGLFNGTFANTYTLGELDAEVLSALQTLNNFLKSEIQK